MFLINFYQKVLHMRSKKVRKASRSGMQRQAQILASLEKQARRLYAAMPVGLRVLCAARAVVMASEDMSYTRSDIDLLFKQALQKQGIQNVWNWGDIIIRKAFTVFRKMQSATQGLTSDDFNDALAHAVTTLATGVDSLSGTRYSHGDIGKVVKNWTAEGLSPDAIAKGVGNRVYQLMVSWQRKVHRHKGHGSLDEPNKAKDGEKGRGSLVDKIMDLESLNRPEKVELTRDLKIVNRKIMADLMRRDPELAFVWQAYLQNPDISSLKNLGKELIEVADLDGRMVKMTLIDAMNLHLNPTGGKPYDDKRLYYLRSKLKQYLQERWVDVIEAALAS